MANNFKQEIDNIEIPAELHQMSALGIRKAKQELTAQAYGSGMRMKRLWQGTGGIIAASALAFAFMIAVEPGLASSVKGYFKDIWNWKGAVTGAEYEQATDEIKVETHQPMMNAEKVIVPLTVTILHGNKVPYSEIEAVTLGDFKVIGSSGEILDDKEIAVQAMTEKEYSFEIRDSDKLLSETVSDDKNSKKFQANLLIRRDFFERNNSLTLKINSFYGHKKGDAPLAIKGQWEKQIKLQE
jgi:hypothetical protein